MAHHRLGHAEEAARWLAQADRARTGELGGVWWDSVEFWLIRREARELIHGPSAATDHDALVDPVATSDFASGSGRLAALAPDLEPADASDPGVARVKGEAAWALVADRRASARSIALGIRLARSSIAAGSNPANRNALGAALYRAGDPGAALVELEEADRLDDGEQWVARNGLFLAMAHSRLGHAAQAADALARSTAWMEANAPDEPDLRRLRDEAEAVVRLDPLFPADPFRK